MKILPCLSCCKITHWLQKERILIVMLALWMILGIYSKISFVIAWEIMNFQSKTAFWIKILFLFFEFNFNVRKHALIQISFLNYIWSMLKHTCSIYLWYYIILKCYIKQSSIFACICYSFQSENNFISQSISIHMPKSNFT